MPVIPVRSSELPKSNILPEMTVRVRVNKCEHRNPQALKDAGKIKAESTLVPGLNLDLVVMDDGEYLGRHIFDGVDLEGQFAHRTRQFLDAVEYPTDEDIDTDRIADAELVVVLGVQKESVGKDGNTYEARNRVKKFMRVDELAS